MRWAHIALAALADATHLRGLTVHTAIAAAITMAAITTIASCTQDEQDDITATDETVRFGVYAPQWQEAIGASRVSSRAGDINSTEDSYPAYLYVYATSTSAATGYESTPFYIKRDTDPTATDYNDNTGYYSYHGAYTSLADDAEAVSLNPSSIADWRFTAYAVTPSPDTASPTITAWQAGSALPTFSLNEYLKSGATSYTSPNHVLFALNHQQAMIRFCFREVDALRTFRLTKLVVSSTDAGLAETTIYSAPAASDGEKAGWLIPGNTIYRDNTSNSSIEYSCPTTTTTSGTAYSACLYAACPASGELSPRNQVLTVTATYDVYDFGLDGCQDGSEAATAAAASGTAATDDQLTRHAVTVSNKVTLSFAKATDRPFPTAGYYYDLLITLDPDFLYVLSDNDDPTPGLVIEQ